MAYAAVISLKRTIDSLLDSSTISIVPKSSPEIIGFLHQQILSLKSVLQQLDSISISSSSIINTKKVNALDEQIRDAVCELEDAIESHLSPQSEEIEAEIQSLTSFSLDLQKLKPDSDSFTQKTNTMKAAYIHELRFPFPDEEEEEDEDDNNGGPNINSDDEKKMVGLSDQYVEIRKTLAENHAGLVVVSLVGMAGIGKTALANKLFRDPLISSSFDKHAFVKIGPKYKFGRVLLDILRQVVKNRDVDEEIVAVGGGEEKINALEKMITDILQDSRYLIVLDDVWNTELLSRLKNLFPWRNGRGSQVLVTTRLHQVADKAHVHCKYDIRFLDGKESWDLLRRKVFDEMPCPRELEKAGKKIAENCEGLPLTIVTVGKILSEAEKTTEYWNKVAIDKQNAVFVDVYEQMFEVLYPSYNYLPQYLKSCFLYMGVFPQNCKIPFSKLLNLWLLERFLELEHDLDSTNYGVRCLINLVSRSLVMVHEDRRYTYRVNTCRLHSSYWYMCNKEAEKIKFFHALKSRADGLAQGIESQRRLCIRNNVLLGIKDVYDSMASISSLRSLLCTGPYHEYQVPICLEYLSLLRILDALTVRFYEFPMEVVKLVQLRYLALTYDGNLPSSISKLWNLEYLIVERHLRIIKHVESIQFLPREIWNMEKLKHLKVTGCDLPYPCEGSFLPNLLTLVDVSAQSCTRDVLSRIPNLLKLGIRIELALDNVEPLCLFDHISNLRNLSGLKCVVVNPRIMSEFIVAPLSIFSSSLEKLTLSGLGYPWEEMSKIASSLPNLVMLKLRCYAFRGQKWEVRESEFPRLEFLLIEDTDLVHWTVGNRGFFLRLKKLSIRHCYRLVEIPIKKGFNKCLKKVQRG
ncbi:hypothetical protein ABFX02_04G149800 [Erythranthe guttata]